MIGIYFSGTGNTKYCLEKFVALYDRNIEITPLEDTGTMEKAVSYTHLDVYKRQEVTGRADLTVYADAEQVSAFAQEAMEWARCV